MARKPYPSDVTDEEWSFVAPYLTLMREDAPQRKHDLREVFNAMRWVVRTGSPWRYMPNDLPPWEAVYQQSQALAGRGGVRGDGPGPAAHPAGAARASGRAVGDDLRQPHAAVDARERRAARVRRRQ